MVDVVEGNIVVTEGKIGWRVVSPEIGYVYSK